jgi:fumarate reductase flavoprotein subunit
VRLAAGRVAEMTQVTVVGAGLAGLVAGVELAEQGVNVTVLEKGTETRYLCNTRYSGGGFHLGLRNMRAAPEALYEQLRADSRGVADEALLHTLATNATPALEWLSAHGAQFGVGGAPEFMSNMLQPFSLRETGLAGHWRGKGADLLLERLDQRLVGAGAILRRGCAAVNLRTRRNAVTGVDVRFAGGATSTVASHAVVLADGGFQSNTVLVRQHICRHPERLLQRGAATGNGDGMRMAAEAGAKLVGLDRFYGHVMVREAIDNTRFWPYPLLDGLTSAGILVDPSGTRFTDEGLGGIATANAIAGLDDPLSAVLVIDSAIWEGRGRQFQLPPNPALVDADVTIYSADNIAELARRLAIPEHSLLSTVTEYNRALSCGTEHALRPGRSNDRGTWELQAQPIARPPFLAVRVCAGISYTTGGIAVDENAQVIAETGRAISGLYAAGATTGGFEGGPNGVYVGGLARAAIFGLLAARAIARQLQRR